MRPEAEVFFVDRSLGRRWVPEALARAGLRVELHDQHFAPSAPDVEWLQEAGRRGWIVVTRDDAIRRRPLERRALLEAGVRVFVVRAPGAPGPELAELLSRRAQALVSFARAQPAPFVAAVSYRGIRLLRLRA